MICDACHTTMNGSFTWSRKSPFIARKLDYILEFDELLNKYHDCQMHSVAQSDHAQTISLPEIQPA